MERSTMIRSNMGWRRGLAIVAAVIGLATTVQVSAAQTNPGVLPPGSNYGATSGVWGARWWQWAASQPLATNPLADASGVNCAVAQSGPVWFLAGISGGGTANRTCTVPSSKAIFFPVANAFSCGFPEDNSNFGKNRVASQKLYQSATNVSASIDGRPVQNLQSYQAHSTNFSFTVPADTALGLFGYPLGSFFCEVSAADGIYLMLAPLSVGTHTVHLHAEFPGFDPLDVNYVLTVVP
jgi:hypothetical protein